MGKIKVCSLLPYGGAKAIAKYLRIEGLPFTEDFVDDDEAPDYLFAYGISYFNAESIRKLRKFMKRRNMIRIFCPGECIAPDLNIWDYAVAFDRKLSDMDRISRIPSSIFWLDDGADMRNDLILRRLRLFCKAKKGSAASFIPTGRHIL